MKTNTCNIANCTEDATHAVDGNPEDGYVASPCTGNLAIWASYCESHALDVALAFAGVYTEKSRNAAIDRIEARVEVVAIDLPITANRAPVPYDKADEAWAVRFVACMAGRGEATAWFA